MIVAAMIVSTLFVTAIAAPGEPEQTLRAALVHLLAHLLDDVVLALEEAEPAAAVRQVVHVAGQRLDEAVHLVDELRARTSSRPRRRRVRSRDRRCPIAAPRPNRPRRSIHETNGSSASARKSEIRSQVTTWREIQTTSSTHRDGDASRRGCAGSSACGLDHPLSRHRTQDARTGRRRTAPTTSIRRRAPLRTARLDVRSGARAATVLVSLRLLGRAAASAPGPLLHRRTGTDPQIFVWSLGWWPHAHRARRQPLLHARRSGRRRDSNLAWATSVPGVALAVLAGDLARRPGRLVQHRRVLMPALSRGRRSCSAAT